MLGLIRSEPVDTTTPILALSRRSVYKSQHRAKGSARRNDSVAVSRPDYNQREVYWLHIFDPRKTGVSVMIDGKRLLTNFDHLSGLREKRHLVSFSSPVSAQN